METSFVSSNINCIILYHYSGLFEPKELSVEIVSKCMLVYKIC